jgi:hypothetical protein
MAAQGPRVLETSFLSFQSFPPPLASLFPLPLRFILQLYAPLYLCNQRHSPTPTADLLPPACGGAAPQWIPLDLLHTPRARARVGGRAGTEPPLQSQ